MARSSSTAELIASCGGASALFYLRHLLKEITYDHKNVLIVQSKALFHLYTSIRECTEISNKIDLAFIQENISASSISINGWVPGYYNITDPLTKDIRTATGLLLHSLHEVQHPLHADTIKHATETDKKTKTVHEMGEKGCRKCTFSSF